MAVSFSFPTVILCLFVSFHVGLGYSQSQDLVQSFLGNNHQVVPRPINKHHQLGGGYYYVATVYPFGSFQFWQGECFQNNNAYLTYTQDFGLGTIVVEVSQGVSTFCSDYYQFKAGFRLLAEDYFYSAIFSKEVVFDSSDPELRRYIQSNGVDIYLWRSGIQQKQEEKVMEPLIIGGGGASATARV
ncbi:hypothetical protein Tsubulata_040401 [Turnera subulata]|uniref:Neprosin domain-containing protein n=1 Tax=Turnera subulata TaxID=218843 RepID=A0A9Q0FH72_9ROSI|nr:hypothetical protein Tsubulata_040401 [Turnera subulata]